MKYILLQIEDDDQAHSIVCDTTDWPECDILTPCQENRVQVKAIVVVSQAAALEALKSASFIHQFIKGTDMKDNPLTLLAKHLGCSTNDLEVPRQFHHGMLCACYKSQEYALGAPGFTENYYGPEIKLHDTLSAYRLTPENPDEREIK